MWQSTISLRYVSYKNADSDLHERICAIVMLLQKKPMIAFPLGSGSWRDPGPMYGVEIISPSVAHIFGSLAILLSVLIVILYFWARRVIARDPRPHVVEHGRRII